jgi:pSer/pThr/pTyr-binding forkhead associated (FHA) protein
MSQHTTDLFRASCGANGPLELHVSGPGWAGAGRHVFEYPFVLVGGDERSCLRLEDGEVSRRHAHLQQLRGRVFCVDLGSRTGTRWGGEPRPAGWLGPGAAVQIGPYSVELATAAPAGGDPGEGAGEGWRPLQDRVNDPRLLPRVVLEISNGHRSRWRVNRALVLVGGSSACRVRLRHESVSRYHCSLVGTPEGVWAVDLLSRTGTVLNGQPVRWAPLRDGDRLQVGAYVLRVWYENGGPEKPPFGLSEIQSGVPAQPAEGTAGPGPWGGRGPDEQVFSSPPVAPPAPAGQPMPPGNGTAGTRARPGEGLSSTAAPVLPPALRAELDRAREYQRDAEALRRELADSQAECERLGERVRALEAQVAEMARLQTQFEAAAEAAARELDDVRGERDRWQAETQAVQARLTSAEADREQLGHLAADLQAAQVERDRLRTEHQASLHSAEKARTRVGHLERALQEATEAHETALAGARAGWESERQALAARLEQERAAHATAAEAHVAAAEARAAEREEGRRRLEAAERRFTEEREALLKRGEQAGRQAAILREERDGLASRLAKAESSLRAAEERYRDEAGRAAEELERLRRQAALPEGHDELPQHARPLRVEIDRAPAHAEEQRRRLAALEQEFPATGREQPATAQGPASQVVEQAPEPTPDVGGESAVGHRPAPGTTPAVQAGAGPAPPPPDTPHGLPPPHAMRPSEENLHLLLRQRMRQVEQKQQGLWRKVLNFVLGK